MGDVPVTFRTLSPALLLFFLHFLLLPSASVVHPLSTESFTLGNPFDDSYRQTLTALTDAAVNGGVLQLTPDSRNDESYRQNKSGRVLYPRAFKIWEDSAGRDSSMAAASSNNTGSKRFVISFNTSFDFNIFRERNQTAVGEGFAFIIAADRGAMPAGSEGGYLGLTNATIDGNATNQLVAIEFDTVKQSHDPDNNHVGLDINSVISTLTRPLSAVNITISPVNPTNYTAWVDYNGSLRRVYVFVAVRGRPKPAAPVLNASLDLGDHVAQRSYFGFAASTSELYELNCILAWNLTVEILPEDGATSALSRFLEVGVPILAVLVVLAGVFSFYLHRKMPKKDKKLVGTLKSLPGMPREFKYKELKRATGGFNETNKLGQGGFGIVYKGLIPGEGTQVAVKKFSRETKQGDFLAELTIINRLRHRHLVRLLGWCHKNGKLLLVYEYMSHGGLDAHLYNLPPGGTTLPWDRRYKILAGVASALHYLHNEYEQMVVHRDLKASNVLLDADFNARLGDFGLARAIDNERTSYVEVDVDGFPGTRGYVAPECFHTGKSTDKSDVYGFGAVVLEVVCGRRPLCVVDGFRSLVDWVWKLYGEGRILEAVDPQLGGEYVAADAERLLLLGLACCNPRPLCRSSRGRCRRRACSRSGRRSCGRWWTASTRKGTARGTRRPSRRCTCPSVTGPRSPAARTATTPPGARPKSSSQTWLRTCEPILIENEIRR